jgi:hypothetical protein
MSSTNTKTKNLIRMKVDLAATGAQDSTSVALDATPFLGTGSLIFNIEALDGTAILKLQQAPQYDPATGAKPVTGSSLWTDIGTWDTTVATTALKQEIGVAADTYHVRANVTTLHAASFAIFNITPTAV